MTRLRSPLNLWITHTRDALLCIFVHFWGLWIIGSPVILHPDLFLMQYWGNCRVNTIAVIEWDWVGCKELCRSRGMFTLVTTASIWYNLLLLAFSKFGQCWLVLKNLPRDFSKSEMGKYFKWIVIYAMKCHGWEDKITCSLFGFHAY